jgi:hypothetical protein
VEKLTETQKTAIRLSVLNDVKDDEQRSKILSIAFMYAEETGQDDDLEKMALFLMNNPNRIDELFKEFVGYQPENATESKSPKKR